MSDDPDFQKANHALQVLRQARSFSLNQASAASSLAKTLR
jgi:hypothetical protein